MKNYKLVKDKYFAVLFRKTEKDFLESCVFCGENHKHGAGNGHRVAHCGNVPTWLVIDSDAQMKSIVVSNVDGYYIQTLNPK